MSSASPDPASRRPNPLILPMVVVSILAVVEGIGLVILLVILAGRGSSPAPIVATGDAPQPAAPSAPVAAVPATPPAKAGPPAAGLARGKRGQRVESAGFGITVEKIAYEPTYKDLAQTGADQRYLALLILVENNTGGNAGLFTATFRLQDNQGFEYEPLALKLTEPALEWRTLGNREKVRGYVDFFVPKAAKGLTLVYSHLPREDSQPIHVELAE